MTPEPAREFRFIPTRDEVITQAIEMFNQTQSTLEGQGEDIDWVRTPGEVGEKIQQAFDSMLSRNVVVDLISTGTGTYALETSKILEDYNSKYGVNLVSVTFLKYGTIRVLISDKFRIILAFNQGKSSADNSARYFGVYIESETIGNWLTLRHRRLKESPSALPLTDKFSLLTDYEHKVSMHEVLNSRTDYVKKLIELVSNSNKSIIISSQQASWILEEKIQKEFESAIKNAIISNGVRDIRILVARNDLTTRKSLQLYQTIFEKLANDLGIDKERLVSFKQDARIGQVRYAVVDKRHVLLAFPTTPTQKKRRHRVVKEYNPLFLSDELLASWLETRFDQQWQKARTTGLRWYRRLLLLPKDIWLQTIDNPYNIILIIISSLIISFFSSSISNFFNQLISLLPSGNP